MIKRVFLCIQANASCRAGGLDVYYSNRYQKLRGHHTYFHIMKRDLRFSYYEIKYGVPLILPNVLHLQQHASQKPDDKACVCPMVLVAACLGNKLIPHNIAHGARSQPQSDADYRSGSLKYYVSDKCSQCCYQPG